MKNEATFTGFSDRRDAGRHLAKALAHYRARPETIVVGLPRGGVITASVIAEELALPLEVLVVRKLGTPGYRELAMGAIGPGGIRVLNDEVISSLRLTAATINAVAQDEQTEVERRELAYRGGRHRAEFARRTVILVDDGVATGSTMAAAIAVMRRMNPRRIVLAVPVAPINTFERFRSLVDELICLQTPEPFRAVGCWYRDFSQVEDREVVAALAKCEAREPALV